jgi:hypothetical protein
MEDALDRDARQAWLAEGLRRTKRLPALESLMLKHQQKAQTVEEQRSILHILAAQYGGIVRRGK